MPYQRLLTAASTDGNSSAVDWLGGSGTFGAWGTFGAGASVKLEASFNGTNFVDLSTGASLSAAGLVVFDLPAEAKLRAAVAGTSTGDPSAITAEIRRPDRSFDGVVDLSS